jgi:hypothetical protein
MALRVIAYSVHFNIIFPSTSRSFKRCLSLTFGHHNSVCTVPPTMRAAFPANLIPLRVMTLTVFGEQHKPHSSSLCNYLQSPAISSLSDPNISTAPSDPATDGRTPPPPMTRPGSCLGRTVKCQTDYFVRRRTVLWCRGLRKWGGGTCV